MGIHQTVPSFRLSRTDPLSPRQPGRCPLRLLELANDRLCQLLVLPEAGAYNLSWTHVLDKFAPMDRSLTVFHWPTYIRTLLFHIMFVSQGGGWAENFSLHQTSFVVSKNTA